MDLFLSCDWGTSSFRLRLVRVSDLGVLAETTNGQGIAETYRQWSILGDKEVRAPFYATYLNEGIAELSLLAGRSLTDIPVVLSGMGSSSIGMMELAYKRVPIGLDGKDFLLERFEFSRGMNPVYVISGIQTDSDVMRGEETKLVGCSAMLADDAATQLIILPGTHSKHVTVRQQEITIFKTYMTGEFFKLLSVNSVLSASVDKKGVEELTDQQWFREGVRAAKSSTLLHAAFLVRTNELLHRVPKAANFSYLSGVLIGSELSDIPSDVSVYLIAGSTHHHLYKTALDELKLKVGGVMDADSALISGQYRLLSDRF